MYITPTPNSLRRLEQALARRVKSVHISRIEGPQYYFRDAASDEFLIGASLNFDPSHTGVAPSLPVS